MLDYLELVGAIDCVAGLLVKMTRVRSTKPNLLGCVASSANTDKPATCGISTIVPHIPGF